MEIWNASENKNILLEASDGKKEKRTCSIRPNAKAEKKHSFFKNK